MNFTTPVTEFERTFALTGNDRILSLGSCFASVVGQRLKDNRVKVLLNPFGTLYNPLSIFRSFEMALDVAEGKAAARDIAKETVFKGIDSRWYSWEAASLISGSNKEECVGAMAEALSATAAFISKATVVMLTFGTDHYYSLQSTRPDNTSNAPLIVANCHKMPQSLFDERIADTEEVVSAFSSVMERLLEVNPLLKIILTLSPYRYLKYGLHRSRLSKARLLLAIDAIESRWEQVSYFPAYEILNDELRDYRFYREDMLHPSPVAEQYIWETFCEHYIHPRLLQFFRAWAPILKYRAHRPITGADTAEADRKIQARLDTIKSQYPEMFRD